MRVLACLFLRSLTPAHTIIYWASGIFYMLSIGQYFQSVYCRRKMLIIPTLVLFGWLSFSYAWVLHFSWNMNSMFNTAGSWRDLTLIDNIQLKCSVKIQESNLKLKIVLSMRSISQLQIILSIRCKLAILTHYDFFPSIRKDIYKIQLSEKR